MNTTTTTPFNNIDNNIHLIEKDSLSVKSLLAITILLTYITCGSVFKKLHINIIHESGLCMILGILISLIVNLFTSSISLTLRFDDSIFFTFILPPIVFSAGYNMHCKNFFKYFHYAIIFGIFGTFLSFLLTSFITYAFNYTNIFSMNLTLKDILLFSSVISATDTVSPLAFVSPETHTKLFEVLFGEGIINDSFSIVLYQLITRFYGYVSTAQMVSYFVFLFISSLLLGISIGFTCALFLKYMKPFKLHRYQEISIIVLFAFCSYIIAEIVDLSAILTLLFCSIALSNYAFYNLSFQAREESCTVAKLISNMAEAFVFTYLGLSFVTMSQTSYAVVFVVVEFVTITFARVAAVWVLTTLTNAFSDVPFTHAEKKVISIAGCIRGAIAFGLAMSFETGDTAKNAVLLSTTLILVFVSTVVFGAYVPVISKECKEGGVKEEKKYYLLAEDDGNVVCDEEGKEEEELTWLGRVWFDFDRNVLKPILVGDWERCLQEHLKMSEVVKSVVNE